MNDLLGMEVEHAVGYLSGPAHYLRRQDLFSSNEVIEVALRTVLHHNTETRRLYAHTSVCVCVCVCVLCCVCSVTKYST